MANASTGILRISATTATKTPTKIRVQGRVPPITPSITIFIKDACGAANCSEPNPPQELLKRYITPPIDNEETRVPIISPICCFLGVAPTIYPVFKSWEVAPAIAATIHITVPIDMAAIIPFAPVVPVDLSTKVVIIRVAIAIPDTGLLLLPTNPTILEDTVAKKNPNIIINMAPRGFMVIPGIKHMATAITKIPVKINHIGKSLAVLSPPDTFLPKPFMACLKVFTIVGNVLIRLIMPPAATAPAPIYLT